MDFIFASIIHIILSSWRLLLDAAPYMLFGLVIGGFVKVFLSSAFITSHLGQGRIASVLKAALLGIPLPLCSCSVLPAAISLKKQGANSGATVAFLVSTPESGVDSISITYALMDPLMTAARPIAAFLTAVAAGLIENFTSPKKKALMTGETLSTENCADDCCSAVDAASSPDFFEKCISACKYAFTSLWADIAGWFFIGIILGGIISAFVPDNLFGSVLGGGIISMLIMLTAGIPLYICATASTPIAAALIIKGVSPGAALVFLLVGPATNIASLSVLYKTLGKKTTSLYLAVVAVFSVCSGLLLDIIYTHNDISIDALTGKAAEFIPLGWRYVFAVTLLLLSIQPLARAFMGFKHKIMNAGNPDPDSLSTAPT